MKLATPQQLLQLQKLVIDLKVPSDRLQRWFGGCLAECMKSDPPPHHKLKTLLSSFQELEELSSIIIPEDATIASLTDAGMYDYQSDDVKAYITDEHSRVTVTGYRPLYLARFMGDDVGLGDSSFVCNEQVIDAAQEMGCELARIEDLLAFGAHHAYRELQLKFPIVALGSSIVINGKLGKPGLDKFRDGRKLDMFFNESWADYICFLLVAR